jgi:hypothetical protein
MNLEIWTKLPTKDKPFNTAIILEGLEECQSQTNCQSMSTTVDENLQDQKGLQSQMSGMVMEVGGDQSGSG